MAPFTGFATLDPQTVALIKYAFLALATAQFGIIKALQKILPTRSVENLSMAAVVTFALCESVGVLGLVLFFLAGNSMDFYIFMVISLGFFYPIFPQIRAVGRAAAGGRFPSEN